DLIKRRNVGGQDHIHLKTGILQADRNITVIDQHPITSLRCAAKVELYDHAQAWNVIEGDPPTHPPQQDDRIEFVWSRSTKGPAGAPLAEEIDDWLELASCSGQAIFRPLPARATAPFQDARLLQPPQPFGKQRPRHMRKAAFKLVEMIYVGK